MFTTAAGSRHGLRPLIVQRADEHGQYHGSSCTKRPEDLEDHLERQQRRCDMANVWDEYTYSQATMYSRPQETVLCLCIWVLLGRIK
jgi:hypothetical protein